jgi:transcription initiation factor IIE alpha subunit
MNPIPMPKKWCPKCQEVKGIINRVLEVLAAWDEQKNDYIPLDPKQYSVSYDTCQECGSELVIDDSEIAGYIIELVEVDEKEAYKGLRKIILCRDHCEPAEKARAKEEDIITWDMASAEGFRCRLCGEKLSKKLVAT